MRTDIQNLTPAMVVSAAVAMDEVVGNSTRLIVALRRVQLADAWDRALSVENADPEETMVRVCVLEGDLAGASVIVHKGDFITAGEIP